MIAKTEKLTINRIPDDEPIFILRAQDELACEVVKFWIEKAEEAGVRSSKIAQARDLLEGMQRWPTKKLPD